jgi:hypothetical protein
MCKFRESLAAFVYVPNMLAAREPTGFCSGSHCSAARKTHVKNSLRFYYRSHPGFLPAGPVMRVMIYRICYDTGEQDRQRGPTQNLLKRYAGALEIIAGSVAGD